MNDSVSAKGLPERKRTKGVTVVSSSSDRRPVHTANEIVDLVGKDLGVDFTSYPIREQRKGGRYKFILVR